MKTMFSQPRSRGGSHTMRVQSVCPFGRGSVRILLRGTPRGCSPLDDDDADDDDDDDDD